MHLIGFQPPRHVAKHLFAHTRAGKHQLPEFVLSEANKHGWLYGSADNPQPLIGKNRDFAKALTFLKNKWGNPAGRHL
jgi:hypothetical protein